MCSSFTLSPVVAPVPHPSATSEMVGFGTTHHSHRLGAHLQRTAQRDLSVLSKTTRTAMLTPA